MLRQLKADVQTKMIRVVIMTISTQDRDLAGNQLRANGYWRLPSQAPPWGG